jgi:ABC-type transport system involved in multi-copper enzyme maturation permease subunit
MLKNIIQKEILNNIFSSRFLVTFLLLVVIVFATSVILTNDYVRKQDEFSRRQTEIENYLRDYAHFNRIGGVINPAQPPLAFYSLIRGISLELNIEEFDNDPLPVMFPLIDLTFIVTILLSLVALLFSYDAICGEKEEGTLKLMLSNNVSRAKVLLGKAIGGTLTLLIPFAVSLGLSQIVILFNPRISWKGSDWGALGLIFFAAALYVTLFYCLGVLISSRHKSGSSSIMTSLFIWVLFILVIPSLSPYVASFFAKTPSKIRIDREVSRITDVERDELGRKLMQERQQEVQKKFPNYESMLTREERQRRIASDPEFKKADEEMTQAVNEAWNEANRIQGEKVNIIRADQNRKIEAQMRLSIYLSMLSPLSSFIYLATDLSATGMRSLKHFGRLTERYDGIFGEYEKRKEAEMREKDPTIDIWNSPVDVSDMPRFQYTDEGLLDRFKGVLPFLTALILFNILFFTAAFFSFIRYDVR